MKRNCILTVFSVPASILVLALVAPAAMAGPDFIADWGSPGAFPGQFNLPTGIAVGAQGRLFVSDGGNDRIQVFTAGGLLLGTWGTSGSAPGQFRFPAAVAADGSGHVFVADMLNHRVQKFDAEGALLGAWTEAGPGDPLKYVRGVAVDGEGFVYVSDAGNMRIVKYTGDGGYVMEWGGEGEGPGLFRPRDSERVKQEPLSPDAGPALFHHRFAALSGPGALTVDRAGQVYVLEPRADRVLVFSTTGTPLHTWGRSGTGPGEFNVPLGISVDGSGIVHVSDAGNYRVQLFTSRGDYITEWAVPLRAAAGAPRSPLEKVKQQSVASETARPPLGIWTAGDGRVYLSDGGDMSVRALSYASPTSCAGCDVMPSSCPNVVHAMDVKVPVVLMGSCGFSPANVDPCTVRLAGAGTPLCVETRDMCVYGDGGGGCTPIPRDCVLDLYVEFTSDQVKAALHGPKCGEIRIVGLRRDGTPFWAADQVQWKADPAPGGRPRDQVQSLSIPAAVGGDVRMSLYDVGGRLVDRWMERDLPAESREIRWDSAGHPNGVYFLRVEAPGVAYTQKVLIAR